MIDTPTSPSKKKPTVAEIFRGFGKQLSGLSAEHKKAVKAITQCRTEALGGHLYECGSCGHQEPRYHSCRNRHCPQCQSLAREKWLELRKKELFPSVYFHVVFTLPHILNDLLLRNKREGYAILFKAVSRTLLQVGRRRLGGQMGFFGVLHTWDQQMGHHPHLHCVVPGGALSPDHSEWIASDKEYLFPVRVLSEVFRGKFLSLLERSFEKERLIFPGKIAALQTPAAFQSLLKSATVTNWNVYAKPAFEDPVKLLDYLGRYTHRIAISNHRLESLVGDQVTFTYLDRKAEIPTKKRMTLPVQEFMRRFLLHILPKNFYRIRYFGFLAGPVRKKRLAVIHKLLKYKAETRLREASWQERLKELTGKDVNCCDLCQTGTMNLVQEIFPTQPKRPSGLDINFDALIRRVKARRARRAGEGHLFTKGTEPLMEPVLQSPREQLSLF